MDNLSECAKCHKTGQENALKLCSRCRNRSYCGNECQSSDWPSHKANCKRENYVLKVELQGVSNPIISRTLSCPANSTFEDFHLALQIAFGYSHTHTYDFKIKDPNAEPETELDIMTFITRKMAQDDAQFGDDPMPDMAPKQNLFRIVQKDAMEKGFIDSIHNRDRKHSQTPEKYGENTKLWQVFDKMEYQGCEIEYEYDFGDNWEHKVTLVRREIAGKDFVCLEGQGHGVAEDVGSRNGWEELKAAYQASAPTQEQREKMHWYQRQASNCDKNGLAGSRVEAWDKEKINQLLTST